jgi:exopolyphosphatase/pppGpp-phosphohydrolase
MTSITRGCLDIGSGSTKLLIARYCPSSNCLTELFSDLTEVLFGQSWKINGHLDQEIQSKGIETIEKYVQICKEYKVMEMCAVATEVQ